MLKAWITISIFVAGMGSVTLAQTDTPLFSGFEKVAVFPFVYESDTGAPSADAATSLDEAWWQIREELTDTGRFLVASRGFLQRADAFQPRADLNVGDVVILSRHVEADVLITGKLKHRTLVMTAWDGQSGSKLWQEAVELHPSILVRDQVPRVARGLAREFIARLPYQGLTVNDSLARQAVIDDAGRKIVRVKLGAKVTVAPGDPVQWVVVRRSGLEPLLQGGSQTTVVAVGTVLTVPKVNEEAATQIVTVELTRLTDSRVIRHGTLAVFPKEVERMNREYLKAGQSVSQIATQMLQPAAEGAKQETKTETRPIATTLSIIASLAALLLLAF